MVDYLYPLLALSQCLLLAGLVVRPSPYRWMLWPLIACIDYRSFFLTTNDPCTNEVLHFLMVLYLFHASDYILLTDVQRELRLPNQQPISNAGLWSRIKWGLQLLCNPRGVGWAHEPRSTLPPHPNLTRLQFLTSRFLRLAIRMLMNDIGQIMIRADPFLARGAPPSAQQPWLWRFWSVSLVVFTQWCALSIAHTSCSIVFVASGLSTPDSWPDTFGKWRDAYTLRRYWGYSVSLCSDFHLLTLFLYSRTWQQFLRRVSLVKLFSIYPINDNTLPSPSHLMGNMSRSVSSASLLAVMLHRIRNYTLHFLYQGSYTPLRPTQAHSGFAFPKRLR